MKFDVILADPPWKFEVWDRDTGRGRSAESHYPTMSLEEICSLQIKDITADNCALFLWAVWPSIFDAYEVIGAWGFEYKTCAWVWVKSKPSGFGFHFGMGYYTRANTEPCLLAVKGRMPVAKRDVSALIYYPVKEHSQKPEEQYNKIERLYPGSMYCELFARRKHRGWFSWGNEIESDISVARNDDPEGE